MIILDTLKNLVSGLGTAKDKSVSTTFVTRIIDPVELNAMYRADWLPRKIVDIIPNDMTREWRDWQAKAEEIEKIEALEKSPLINLQVKVNLAMRLARLHGGAAIYLGMKDGTPDQPLVLDKVKAGDLLYIHVLKKGDVSTGAIIRDVASEHFGEPSSYTINGTSGAAVTVHPSRMVRFVGAEILDEDQTVNTGWGDSVLQSVYDAIQNATSAPQHVAALIPELKTDVIYIPGLSKFLRTQQDTTALTSRFTYANTVKSAFNMLLLEGDGKDQGEKWDQKQINFSHLPELIQQFLQIAAGAADIPVTRLLGQSPSGLNATGDADIRNYYDNVSARQRTELSPRLHRLDEVIIRSALGKRDPAIYYEWSPLWSMSEKEKAEIFKTKIGAMREIAGNGTNDPMMMIEVVEETLINMLIEDGTLPGLEAAVEEFGKGSDIENQPGEAERDAAAAVTGPDDPAQVEAGDATPMPLYVRRDVVNAAEIIAHFKAQGFETTLPADDLHVTIMYSRAPVDWMKMGQSWSGEDGRLTIPAGGVRLMEQFDKATVMLFVSSELSWRHEDMRRGGASWDHAEYQPHVTISYDFAGDLTEVEPYRGKIVLGPEIFEPIDEDWQSGIREE